MGTNAGYNSDMIPNVQVIEHPGEVRLRLRAATPGDLALVAGRALAELELGRAPGPAEGVSREIVVQGRDREAVLVHWLNELIYLAEVDRWVGVEFTVQEATETELRVRARGITVDEAPSRVKAATFHGLRIASVTDGVEADVVLDV
jgi:SHS2 domain-containing protein